MNTITGGQRARTSRLTELLLDYGAVLGMLIVVLLLGLIEPKFLRFQNLLGVLNSSSILIVLSLAMMMAMSVRGVNLSVAQTADAAGLVAAMCIINGMPWYAAVLAAVLFGLVVGAINAFTVSYLGVPAIIGTLGMMFIIRSFELTITNGAQPQILFSLPAKMTKTFLAIGQGKLAGISLLIILTVIISVAVFAIKERSTLGRKMDAVGGNARAAFLASINIRRVFAAALVISSVLAALGGIMVTARSGSAVPRGCETYLNDTFVACFLGTLLTKNKGRMNTVGTIIGAIFVSLLSNWFTLMSFGASYKYIFNGLFIVAAVAVGSLRNRKV